MGNVLAKFKERVSQIPEATAIIYEGQKMTYKQLDELSSKLANYLYKNNYSEIPLSQFICLHVLK